MTTVADLASWMEGFAPTRLAEDWDNVGLLLGDPAATVEKVMTCLTVTPRSASEAVDGGAQLIVSHHPIWFKPVQSLRADRADGFLWPLARAGVALYSPHTAFDNTRGGINDFLCEALGLVGVGPLKPAPDRQGCKVVVFAPEADREAVLSAAFEAGAGRIGDYAECSYTLEGSGTFLGLEGTNPTVGRAGRREVAPEQRIEFVCPTARLPMVLDAVRRAHSYEEPAIDAYPTILRDESAGVGRIGRLPEPTTLRRLAGIVRDRLPAPGLQFVGEPDRRVERVAVACGGADDFVRDASEAGADAFLTGEARFHRALEAEAAGMGMIVAGHHATERPAVEMLADRIGAAFPGLEAWASRRESDPMRCP
ncbi:Nif3-like dinuclear metal center hexameric protein [Tautonia plasticadhaerens]|uniref:GTP cyclohydrolase 1 type 2 homolog n=1 Tax=Tautonia plasticadhaerens TaxID=2527974 RepID=A0A518GX85_9BACT|nr:Nif3-like dinuclear metal center hexameric protein [Tautonia plasticadhaerens]QDV33199.1 Putative GTP cyclohydrolase 1 type 2 [Tautonia plasticadhaerens]